MKVTLNKKNLIMDNIGLLYKSKTTCNNIYVID
jgi:hypothetical protein